MNLARNKNRERVIDPVGPEKLRDWLLANMISDESLAGDLGVSIYAVRKYKSGHRVPRGLVMRKMELITGIPLGDWFVTLA